MKSIFSKDTNIAVFCKALGHPARLQILEQLLKEDRCICGRIVEVLDLAQSTVSQHLKVLKEARIITGEIEGPKTCYCVDHKQLKRHINALQSMIIKKGCCNGK